MDVRHHPGTPGTTLTIGPEPRWSRFSGVKTGGRVSQGSSMVFRRLLLIEFEAYATLQLMMASQSSMFSQSNTRYASQDPEYDSGQERETPEPSETQDEIRNETQFDAELEPNESQKSISRRCRMEGLGRLRSC